MFLEPREIYDKAIVGVMEIPNSPELLVLYNKELVLDSMVNDMGMDTMADAEEFYEYNTLGAWVGEQTPAFALIGEAKTFALEYMQEEFDGPIIHEGLEAAVIGVYERFNMEQTIVYDKFMLTPLQRQTLSVVDTTESALLEFDLVIEPAKKSANP